MRDRDAVARRRAGAAAVFHFAAQVAVTTSLVDPREDFEINALGTLNVLEAARAQPKPPRARVHLDQQGLRRPRGRATLRPTGKRYEPALDGDRARSGIAETRPLDFHSPYGCSKGTADQYVHRLRPQLRPADASSSA